MTRLLRAKRVVLALCVIALLQVLVIGESAHAAKTNMPPHRLVRVTQWAGAARGQVATVAAECPFGYRFVREHTSWYSARGHNTSARGHIINVSATYSTTAEGTHIKTGWIFSFLNRSSTGILARLTIVCETIQPSQ